MCLHSDHHCAGDMKSHAYLQFCSQQRKSKLESTVTDILVQHLICHSRLCSVHLSLRIFTVILEQIHVHMEWITLTLLIPFIEMIRCYWSISHVIVKNEFCLYLTVNSFYSGAPRFALNTGVYSLGTLTPFFQHSAMFSSPVTHSCNPLRPQTPSWSDRAVTNCCCWQQGPTVAPAEPSSLLSLCLFFPLMELNWEVQPEREGNSKKETSQGKGQERKVKAPDSPINAFIYSPSTHKDTACHVSQGLSQVQLV